MSAAAIRTIANVLGVDHEEVKARDLQLSIGVSKNFPGQMALTTITEVTKWLQQLINELSERLIADRIKVRAERCFLMVRYS